MKAHLHFRIFLFISTTRTLIEKQNISGRALSKLLYAPVYICIPCIHIHIPQVCIYPTTTLLPYDFSACKSFCHKIYVTFAQCVISNRCLWAPCKTDIHNGITDIECQYFLCVCVKLMEYLKCDTILQTASSHHGSSFFTITSSDVLIGHMA